MKVNWTYHYILGEEQEALLKENIVLQLEVLIIE